MDIVRAVGLYGVAGGCVRGSGAKRAALLYHEQFEFVHLALKATKNHVAVLVACGACAIHNDIGAVHSYLANGVGGSQQHCVTM